MLYPSPDNVVPATDVLGKMLDECFIEEDLVLAALVWKAGLAKGLSFTSGTRHVTLGSVPIVSRLQRLRLIEVYEAAGFTRGAPGCSNCAGKGVDVAPDGSVWLSSQNRNFHDPMGKVTVCI